MGDTGGAGSSSRGNPVVTVSTAAPAAGPSKSSAAAAVAAEEEGRAQRKAAAHARRPGRDNNDDGDSHSVEPVDAAGRPVAATRTSKRVRRTGNARDDDDDGPGGPDMNRKEVAVRVTGDANTRRAVAAQDRMLSQARARSEAQAAREAKERRQAARPRKSDSPQRVVRRAPRAEDDDEEEEGEGEDEDDDEDDDGDDADAAYEAAVAPLTRYDPARMRRDFDRALVVMQRSIPTLGSHMQNNAAMERALRQIARIAKRTLENLVPYPDDDDDARSSDDGFV